MNKNELKIGDRIKVFYADEDDYEEGEAPFFEATVLCIHKGDNIMSAFLTGSGKRGATCSIHGGEWVIRTKSDDSWGGDSYRGHIELIKKYFNKHPRLIKKSI